MSFDWDAKEYLRFEKERNQALNDLIIQCKQEQRASCVRSILDIGCGPANSTKLLAKHYKHAHILGIDNSQNMLEIASKNLRSKRVALGLLCANTQLHTLKQKFNLIVANASLHWITEQERLFKVVFSLLYKGGIFAVQIPLDYASLFHQNLQKLASSPKWQVHFSQGVRVFSSLSANLYFDMLQGFSKHIQMWEYTYFHHLQSLESIITWYKGSSLRPYLAKLSYKEAKDFENELLDALQKAYTLQKDGSVLLKVPRLFFIAMLPH